MNLMGQEKIHFVTGRLAEAALRNILIDIATKEGFEYSVQVLPISVAALLTPKWIAPRLDVPEGTTRIILPGYSTGDLAPIREVTKVPVEFGPKDLRKLPVYFGHQAAIEELNDFDIHIIAEINHAPRKSLEQILSMAEQMRNDGADFIDVGCEPNSCWSGVKETVRALVSEGHRVSIDSLAPEEIEPAIQAGAELVLSVNASNRDRAIHWGCEVVVIPDDISDLNSLQDTIELLIKHDVNFRIDPILEPIGFGFAASLSRYMEARERWPELEMMMGIGNLTELSDVDSAGVNFLLLAICQELGIRSVLTTEVINWARSSVRECDIARRIVHHSLNSKVPPKHLSEELVQLRDPQLLTFGLEEIESLSGLIKDHNYRLFAENGEIHLLGSGLHLHDQDPFVVFDQLAATQPKNLDTSHAFYLGYEMSKALTALTLGKQFTQDEALDWGHLTKPEINRHRLKKFRGDRESQ